MAGNTPKKIGKYDVIDVIGRGGMGVVYRAKDPFLDRDVAIKMMTISYADYPDLLQRFYREAKATANLTHPNIVTVYELGEHEGSPYMAMQYLEGVSLEALIRSHQQTTVLQKIDIIIQACHGLAYAHQQGLVHRDIKPGNIMVLKDGSVKIVDFGIARIGDTNFTRTGQFMGSLNYMSLEQLNEKLQVDQRTDVYSTGVVLYQFMTGALPFEAESTGATLMKIFNEMPPPFSKFLSSFPSELETITLKALAKDRDQRYASADELAIELIQLQDRLKREAIDVHLQQAERLLQAKELFRAHDQLLEILKIDKQHTRAVTMLRALRKQIEKEQGVDRSRQFREQAEEAFRREEFDAALGYIEQAIGLNTTSVDLPQLRARMQAAKTEAEHLRQVLQRAENARRAGNLDTAKQAIEEVLSLRPNDTRVKSLYRMIQKELEERQKQTRLENLLQAAKKELTNRRYTAAFDILKEAEKIDPDAPQLRVLLEKFTTGRDQEQLRRELEQLTRQVEQAVNADDYQSALNLLAEGVRKFPNDASLLKFKDLAESQKQVAQTKSFVRERIAAAREVLDAGNATSALKILEDALLKAPDNPHLESLLTIAQERLVQDRDEQAKARCIQQANNALGRRAYTEAIQLLEAGQLRFASSTEIDNLLRFAREQQSRDTKQQEVDSSLRRAQEFLRAQEYDRAVQLLESVLTRVPDDEIRIVLEEARRRRDDLDRQIEAAIAKGQQFLAEGTPAKAVEFLQSQPTSFRRSDRFRDLLVAAAGQQSKLKEQESGVRTSEREAPPPSATVVWDRSAPAATEAPLEPRLPEAHRAGREASATRGPSPGARPVFAPPVTGPSRTSRFAASRMPIFVGVGALSLIAMLMVWKIAHPVVPVALVPVEITTVPQGASVRIKGANQACVTPNCGLNLAPGNYEIEAQLQGYESVAQTIAVSSPGPNSVSISMSELPASTRNEVSPPAEGAGVNDETAHTPANELPSRLEISGAAAGSEVVVDGKTAGRVGKAGTFSTNVAPGDRKIKVLAGNQESAIISQHFSAGNVVVMRGSEFKTLPPAQPVEQTDWQKAKDSQNTEDINQFLRRYPNGAFHMQAENRLEDLYWAQDRGTDSPAALRDYLRRYPGGRYSQAANGELARLDWQIVANTKDMASLENYLRVYPAGEYHDKAFGKLDDLVWEKTGRGDDATSLRTYLQTFPTGKHADQGRKELDLVTRPKETASGTPPARPAEQPRTNIAPAPPATATDDKAGVLGVLAAYERSYESEDLQALQKLWPGMTPQQIQGVGDFFKTASSVKLTYIVADNPKISGSDATIEFKQAISYVMNGKFQKPMASKVSMKLKKANAEGTWLIDSIH